MAIHEHLRFILKTPNGYLTSTGTTEDINCNDIIVFNIYRVGGPFASKERSIANFLEHSTADFPVEACKILYYSCPTRESYNCWKCSNFRNCQFWNNRSKVQLCEVK